MRTQKINWWLDALLFLGFMICFFLDLTGVILHEWLGIMIAVLAFIHFAFHYDWTATVLSKFFSGTSIRSRLYLLIDVVLVFGFIGILFTGLIISTWLNLDLNNFTFWVDLHVVISVFSLFMVIIKVALHRKWIICVAETLVFKPMKAPPCATDSPIPLAKTVNRREFLKLGGILGAGTLVGFVHLHRVLSDALSEAQYAVPESEVTNNYTEVLTGQTANMEVIPTVVQPTTSAVAEPTRAVITPTDEAMECSVRCPRNCSYPGRCRRYTDSNGNGKCDNGECA